MEFLIYAVTRAGGDFVKMSSADSLEKAEKKLEKMKHKQKKIIMYPEIKVGSILYKDKKIYGIIFKETESLWWIRKPQDTENTIPGGFAKDEMLNHFVKGHFDPIEKYISDEEGDNRK